MPRQVKGPDGVIRTFPDDVTDDEIASVLEQASPAQPSRLSSAIDAGKRYLKTVGKDLGDLGLGIASMVSTSPQQMAIDASKALTARLIGRGTEGLGMDAAEIVSGAPLKQMKQEFKEGKYPELAGHATVALGTMLAPKGIKAVKGARLARAEAAAGRAEMEAVARGLGGATSKAEMETVARGLGEGPKPVAGSRLVGKAKSTEQHMADALEDVRGELAKADAPMSTELPPAPYSLGEAPPAAQPATSFPRKVAGSKRQPKATPAPEKGTLVAAPERPAATPPTSNVNQAISEALDEMAAKAEPSPRVEPAPAGAGMSGEGAEAMTPPVELPEAWKPFAAAPEGIPWGASIQEMPGMGLADDVRQTFRESLGGGDLGDARRAVGSEKAARSYDDIAQEIGVDRSVIEQMMRDMTDGPSRRPMAAELAEMDNDYLRQINNERGAVDPKLAVKLGLPVAGAVAGSAMAGEDGNPLLAGALGALGGAAVANPGASLKRLQELRMMGMLSGAALPKSVLGNVGAHLTAAAERGSMAPITEMLRVPTNVKTAARAFRNQPKTISAATGAAPVEGLGRLNLPGRLMGALDEASTASLQRAGLPLDDAQRLLLTSENPVGAGSALNTALNTRTGRFFVPFQRIPVNQFSEGVQSLEGLLPKGTVNLNPVHTSRAGRALTVGSMGAGALAGDKTDNPLALAMLAALAGPRALPFALGAGLTAGPKVLERVGVGLPEASTRDLYDPTRAIDQPALLRLIEQLTAQEQQ